MPPVNIFVVETILLPEARRDQVNVEGATKLLSRMLSAVDAGLEGREFLLVHSAARISSISPMSRPTSDV
ncbi:MAG TPA: hypothetical protein VGT81_23785 [Casimicrobiaceae bacterium]|nr:hypothetical protein [Casimicrobiaceae bacterium]